MKISLHPKEEKENLSINSQGNSAISREKM
jgi:hypothetical protein